MLEVARHRKTALLMRRELRDLPESESWLQRDHLRFWVKRSILAAKLHLARARETPSPLASLEYRERLLRAAPLTIEPRRKRA